MTPEEVYEFWFADALQDAAKAAQRMGVWFRPSQEIDQDIRRRFASALPLAGRGLLAAWEAQPRSCLALILVLDQFPRNIHRGTATAFAYDAQALQAAKRGIAAGRVNQTPEGSCPSAPNAAVSPRMTMTADNSRRRCCLTCDCGAPYGRAALMSWPCMGGFTV